MKEHNVKFRSNIKLNFEARQYMERRQFDISAMVTFGNNASNFKAMQNENFMRNNVKNGSEPIGEFSNVTYED